MNKQNIVFILGAGASEYYGYPTGEELRDEIITKFEGWYEKHITQPESPFLRQNVYNIERLISPKLIRDFIKDFDESGAQIDIFISRNSDYKEYTHLGKLAIILAIMESEWKSYFPNDDEDWYRELFTQLTEGRTKPDDFRISQNKSNVSFITFNYDRSLEHYLHHTLQKIFLSAKPSDISKEINSIPIIHIYGIPALLEWQDNLTNIHVLSYNIQYQ